MQSSHSITALRALMIIVLSIIIIFSGYFLLASRYAPTQAGITSSGISEQSFLVRIIYSGAWNATYYGW